MKKEIYQFSTINALMSGVFKGFFDVDRVKACGDFGLGCSDGLTGEIIIKDRVFMEAKDTHPVRIMGGGERVPFVQITTFCADKTLKVNKVNKNNLYATLAQHTLLDNVFLAVKAEGVFDKVTVRSPSDNGKSYQDAVEVSKNQTLRMLSDIEGTLIGFWTPKFFENVSVAGFHIHFISKDGKIGGHVIDFELKEGDLMYEVKHKLNVELPDDASYLEKNLDIENMSEIIKKVEN